MSHSKTLTIDDAVQEALDGRSNVILCPAHEDAEPSLSVSPGSSQPVVFNCHAGCDPKMIVEMGGLEWDKVCSPMADGFTPEDRWTPVGPASRIWRYTDASGLLLFEVLRVDKPTGGGGKRIFQRRPDMHAKHGRSWNLEGVQRVLYRLPQVLAAVAGGHTVHVTEGEKCADAIAPVIPAGDVSTTNPQGAGKWQPEFTAALAGARVVLYADSDEPGRVHMRQVRQSLIEAGCTVRVVEAPNGVIAATGKAINDVADHLEAGFGLDLLIEVTPEQEVERAKTGFDVLDVIVRPRSRREYVIDRTFAKGERLILIGFEGTGKSTLCRQLAVQCAAGIHPFTGLMMKERAKVLYIDAENHPDQTLDSWGQLVGLAGRHKAPIERGQLTILEEWGGGVDLTSPEGSSWLEERVYGYQPDLVIMGPATNLADRDLRDDEPVRRIKQAVDRARTICNSSFIIEHHAPLKGSMDKERPMRPYGSSLFLKWPDFGYGLKPTDDPKVFEWYKNRGPRMRGAEWPEALREGQENSLEWPWMPAIFDEKGKVV